jgi:hypothetical protein
LEEIKRNCNVTLPHLILAGVANSNQHGLQAKQDALQIACDRIYGNMHEFSESACACGLGINNGSWGAITKTQLDHEDPMLLAFGTKKYSREKWAGLRAGTNA